VTEGARLGDLAAAVGGCVRGNADRIIRGVAALEDAGPDDLSFFTNAKYRDALTGSKAGAILVGPGIELAGRDILEVPEPYVALAGILARFDHEVPPPPGVSSDARVGAGAVLGRDVAIGAFAVIGEGARLGDRVVVGEGSIIGAACEIGEGTQLRPRVVLYPRTAVGARCLLHAGVVLGGDGFGFATSKGVHRKVPQLGRVVVEDDVEIGANSTVDRGTLGETRIGAGTKIDNLVMIAHGVVIGPNGLFAAQTGIAGSTRIGRNVTFAGQSGAIGHLRIGDGAIVAAKAAVYADVGDKAFVAGIPAVDHRSWKRAQASFKALPELRAKVRALEARLEALASQVKGER
jgi:UDP-3-O-[3-hydroxymyristoyl] glucosamine N-acyltransferase